MNNKQPEDLETRVTNRKRDLIAEIIEHKRNSSRYGAAEAIDRLKERLSELSHIIKPDAPWTTLGVHARLRLTEWLTR